MPPWGIGLSIAKNLMKHAGERICVKPLLCKYSSITVPEHHFAEESLSKVIAGPSDAVIRLVIFSLHVRTVVE